MWTGVVADRATDNNITDLRRPAPNKRSSQARVKIDGKYFARDGERFRIKGVTYGPFEANSQGDHFPDLAQVVADFSRMEAIGVNAIRTYYVPPANFLDLCDEHDICVYIDVPWSKHLCFLDSKDAQREARLLMQAAGARGAGHRSVLAYGIGNEIPADIVRWHGVKRVERFLYELADVVKQADPEAQATYANYPPTEYLTLPFLDFATYNVYLHDIEAFHRYLFRLQNQVGDRPLLLGEIGMDTMHGSEEEQSDFLAGHLRDAALLGAAGSFVFAWTDDWFTGGYRIENWAFGITRADRSPKMGYDALAGVYQQTPAQLTSGLPRVSVVVCSYNGASTLHQCLTSLEKLDYPHYEIILIDDGSTDNTAEIASRHTCVKYVYQTNHGLSFARNVGLHTATGAIVAYTDSDCYADPNWLTILVHQLEQSGASAVGGPNLSPDDGLLAACVGSAPGQPTHVLQNDQVAEHIPGCNMAFRREALESINGFAPKYRKAGDDVDLCWRLQQAGHWITFAPGGFVWHHRRQTPRAYLRQQAGYGEAEALLWFDHPDRFNSRGEGKWQGTMYGAGLGGLRLGRSIIYHDTFALGLFQTLYQPAAAHWAMLPLTLEWWTVALFVGYLAFFVKSALAVAIGMVVLTLAIATIQASQSPLPRRYNGIGSRLLITGLCLAQPIVRSWWRYRTRLFPPKVAAHEIEPAAPSSPRMPIFGRLVVQYWDEQWRDRTVLLDQLTRYLSDRRRVFNIDSGWTDWDLQVYCNPWTLMRICTAQEDLGSGHRVFRVRYNMIPTDYLTATILLFGVTLAITMFLGEPIFATLSGGLLVIAAGLWLRGVKLASEVVGIVNKLALEMGLVSIPSKNSPGGGDSS